MNKGTKMISLAISMILVSSFAFALVGAFGSDENGQGGGGRLEPALPQRYMISMT